MLLSHFIVHIPFFTGIKFPIEPSLPTIMSPTSEVFKPFSGQELSKGAQQATDFSLWFFVLDGTKEVKTNYASVMLKMMRLYLVLSISYNL